MTNQDELIKWKTRAWTDPGMVAWYSGRMVENSGTMPLKHALEVGLCIEHAKGRKILDVGIGTGRGSLPLARQGMDVTGIDSSQSMLDETRRLAGNTPITLKLGDVEHLPCADAEFDSLISLNVVVHFPHWRQLLTEWKRVVRPGGHIVFDVHSLDNYRCAHGRLVTEQSLLQEAEKQRDFSAYTQRVAVEDMVREADKQGLTVAAIVPYGAFLGGGNTNYLRASSLEAQWGWRRLLSWMAVDEKFHEFSLFLERELVSRLTSKVTGRYMVVLENRRDEAANQVWLDRNAAVNRLLEAGSGLAPLFESIGVDKDAFSARLNQHLAASSRNFSFFNAFWGELRANGWGGEVEGLLDRDNLERLREWLRKAAQDDEAMEITRCWHALPDMRLALEQDGVCMGNVMEYFLLEQVLTGYLQAFSGDRT